VNSSTFARASSSFIRSTRARSPLESVVSVAFDDPAPPYGPQVRAGDGRDRVLEARFSLAQRLGLLQLDASATLSTNLRYGPEPDYGYAVTLSWAASRLALGFALFGGMGDTRVLLEPPCRRQFLAPSVSFLFASGFVVRAEAAGSIDSGDRLLRLQVAREF
jgi:hypothetical protein